MKTILCSTAWCALLGGLVVSKAQAQPSDRDAVIAVVEAVAVFTQAKNVAGMDTLFASDEGIHIIEGAGVNHGWADYRDNHLGPELESFQNIEYRFYAVEPQLRGDVAWSSFRYDLAIDMERGKMEQEGRGTAVLEKRDGRWLIVHLHTSGRARRQQ